MFPRKTPLTKSFSINPHRFTENVLCHRCLNRNLQKLLIPLGNKCSVNVNLFTFTKEMLNRKHFV